MKKIQGVITYIAVFAVIILFAFAFYRNGTQGKVISYSDFQQAYVDNQIETMTIKEDKMSVEGVLKDGKKFTAYVSDQMLDHLLQNTQGIETKIKYNPPNNMSIWISFIPTLLIVGVLFFVFFMFTQQAQSGGGNRGVMNFGKSKAKMANLDAKKVTFKDVAGADEEKGELEEIVDFLKQPKRYIEMGARIPKGVLLVGPPGTGKTLLAKAIAGEAGVPFFSISGSDFVEMFVGVGASRVRDLFEQAKKNAPCIIFIDEIDAVGRQRGAGLGGGHDEREQTLNQLLVEMDGFGVNEGIIMIAATNRPDILDPALLRPGRFDRRILVGAPDVKGREEVLKVHTRNKNLSEDVDLKVLAKMTPGFSGADLENLTNEAALLAVRNNKSSIDMKDIEEAITRVIAGPEKKSRVVSEYDRRITAVHESGHAVVSNVLEYADPVHEISIIQRGMAAGYTMNLPEEDRTHTSKKQLKDKMVELLGGRVAEKLVIGDISAGAKNDIDRASHIARSMVMEYGMSDVIGPISFGNSDGGEVFLGRDIGKSSNISEETSARIDEEIKKLIDEAYNRAESILKENINKLNAVTDVLLQKEKIDGDEFREIFKNS
ncbi:ATP-dependent zinc metalloprotease FtsH [Clostridium sp. LIBA-8841]|uniref:ATP-dependent zinc metalloprotease FtsH n=1 Tax=Clostridium sp. LIBA-8841 TaxID=2987530 RepID=UPI002AC4C80D|nr:ATP-dependent zinc metalloprotease FtsH [Clostridium sp. LIBA-8841]MDZ5254656.1 ATP-dependent zinc metalloprotease FtsH [Clostridium sp. LIBA-8841]